MDYPHTTRIELRHCLPLQSLWWLVAVKMASCLWSDCASQNPVVTRYEEFAPTVVCNLFLKQSYLTTLYQFVLPAIEGVPIVGVFLRYLTRSSSKLVVLLNCLVRCCRCLSSARTD
jgi:hypothetical protein